MEKLVGAHVKQVWTHGKQIGIQGDMEKTGRDA